MTSDIEKLDEITVKLARTIRESSAKDGADVLGALMYYRNGEHIGTTLHIDPVRALQIAAPLCAAAWHADVVYLICDTWIAKGGGTLEDVEAFMKEMTLGERWEAGDREHVSEAIAIQRVAQDNIPYHITLPYTRVDDGIIWHEEDEMRGSLGEGRIPDAANQVFSQDAQDAWDKAMNEVKEEFAWKDDPVEMKARELAYPIVLLGSMNILQGGALMGDDIEVRDKAQEILKELQGYDLSTMDDGVITKIPGTPDVPW